MKKTWKGKEEKEKNAKTVDTVTHTHKYNLKDKKTATQNVVSDCNEIVKTGNKIKNRRTYIIMPLIVMLILICVIAIIFVVGAQFESQPEIAEINKDKETKEEQISAAVDIAATDIGTNTKATFIASTGEIHIYNSSTSGTATMNKTKWYSFLKKIVDADGNLNAVKTITFDNEVCLPEDASYMFNYSPIHLEKLLCINNIENLNTNKVTDMRCMFDNCKSLTNIDVSHFYVEKVTDMSSMFDGCESLTTISVGSWKCYKLSTMQGMFKECKSLVRVDLSDCSFPVLRNMSRMFQGCQSLEYFSEPKSMGYVGSALGMFRKCSSLKSIDFETFNACDMTGMFSECTNLVSVRFVGRVVSDVSLDYGCREMRGYVRKLYLFEIGRL